MPDYVATKTTVPENWHNKLKNLMTQDRRIIPVRVNLDENGENVLLLTKGQLIKMDSAKKAGKKHIILRFSRKQIRANSVHEGGFLATLLSMASKVLPPLLTGLASGVIGGLAEKAITSGSGLFLSKRGRGCTQIHLVEGGGLYLSPYHNDVDYEGLYLKHDGQLYKGKGLLLGKHSPFKDIPLLGLIL